MVHAIVALHALGKAEILTPLVRLTPAQGRAFAASLYMFLGRGKTVARSILADLLWPGVAEAPRQHRLRQMLVELKRAGMPIEATRETVVLPASGCESDLDVLFIHGAGDIDCVENLQFLPGYTPRFSREYSDWLDLKRGEIGAASSRLLLNEIKRARTRGDWLKVERLAAKSIDVDPFNEEAVLARAEASAMRGAKHEAVTILDRYVADLGPGGADIKLPASLMRRRIAERVSEAAFSDRTQGIFVGRETDMQALTVILDDARAGRGRSCVIWGDPGIGKSRLAGELGRFAELQGVQVRKVACRRGDAHRPLSVFVEAVPMLREMRGALGCSPDTLADLQRLTQFDVGSAKNAPELDPQSIFELIRLAIFDLIDAVSEEQCLMLVVEDVHWVDAASARILGQIADWAAKKQVLLLFTSRVRENPLLDACTRSGLVTHHLRPLSKEAATSLLTEMFDATNERRDDEFLDWCREVGDGNPFFLQELVKQWLETKQRHSIPPSITSVIRDRFSRLSPESTQLLQACSVLGENSTLPRVEKMLNQEPYMLLGALNELSKTAMLSAERKVVGASPDFKLAPKHDLVAKVALEALDPHAEVFLHRRAAQTLEAELDNASQDTTLLWACAQHWQKAGNAERSSKLITDYGDHLLEVGCPTDAAVAFEKALTYYSDAPARENCFSRFISALQMDDDWTTVRRAIVDARENKTISSEPHDSYEMIDLEAEWRTELDHRLLLARLRTCVETTTAQVNHRVAAASLALKTGTDFNDANLLDDVYRIVQPLLTEGGVDPIDASQVRLIYHCMRGDGTKVPALCTELTSAGTTSNNPRKLITSLLNAGYANQMVGDNPTAERFFLECFDACVRRKLIQRAWYVSLVLVRFYLDLDDLKNARKWLRKFDHSSLSFMTPSNDIHVAFAIAKLAIAEGNISEAEPRMHILNNVPVEQQTLMRRTATLSLAVRLALLKNVPHHELELLVDDLQKSHTLNRNVGRQDYEAYSLYLGLVRLKKMDTAREALREYLQHRKERTPPPEQIIVAVQPTPALPRYR